MAESRSAPVAAYHLFSGFFTFTAFPVFILFYVQNSLHSTFGQFVYNFLSNLHFSRVNACTYKRGTSTAPHVQIMNDTECIVI